jgi:ionotropic glutamate receptor
LFTKQAPFVIKSGNNTNPIWSGYCIDLLDEMKREMNNSWSFELYEVPDGEYGVKDRKTQRWNGVIGELANNKADIAVGPVAVMAERESVVDFTVPYYDLVGVSILMKKSASRSHLFKFLTVLDNQVWACIAGAYITTSICMWMLDRLSPFSFSSNQMLYERSVEKRNFTLKECFWFCMTSITPQGGGEAPRNYSGKMAVATWWSFGFIIIACYTANLAAFLTVSRLDSPIESLTHLIEQYRIK